MQRINANMREVTPALAGACAHANRVKMLETPQGVCYYEDSHHANTRQHIAPTAAHSRYTLQTLVQCNLLTNSHILQIKLTLVSGDQE
jgi:hypothetical protein